jgi:hypothetical protein
VDGTHDDHHDNDDVQDSRDMLLSLFLFFDVFAVSLLYGNVFLDGLVDEQQGKDGNHKVPLGFRHQDEQCVNEQSFDPHDTDARLVVTI